VTGYARVLLSDWITLAENRVRADQTAQVRHCLLSYHLLFFSHLVGFKFVSCLEFFFGSFSVS
jgi:hypothetical protein